MADIIQFLARPLFKDKAFLQQKYCVEGLTAQEISELCFSSRSTVSTYLKLYGLSTDRRFKKVGGQTPFGWKVSGRKAAPLKAEEAVINKIKELRSQGYSLRQIAAWLNARGVKTKNRRERWQAATLLKILNRVSG